MSDYEEVKWWSALAALLFGAHLAHGVSAILGGTPYETLVWASVIVSGGYSLAWTLAFSARNLYLRGVRNGQRQKERT